MDKVLQNLFNYTPDFVFPLTYLLYVAGNNKNHYTLQRANSYEHRWKEKKEQNLYLCCWTSISQYQNVISFLKTDDYSTAANTAY